MAILSQKKSIDRKRFTSAVLLAGTAISIFTAFPAQAERINIQAQEMKSAIKSLAIQSGAQIIFMPDATTNRQSMYVAGDYNPEQALTLLLQGSGLTYEKRSKDGTIIIRRIKQSGALKNIGVDDNAKDSAREIMANVTRDDGAHSEAGASKVDLSNVTEIVVTGAKRKFAPIDSSAATKIKMDIIDTPQSLSVLSSELISIVAAKDLGRAAAWAPSVTNTASSMSALNSTSVRGFGVSDFNGYKINGLAFTGVVVPLDLGIIDTVEVVRGPAAIIYGEADYGAVINVRLKKPGTKPSFVGELGTDIDGGYRVMGDVTGALTEDGRLRGRLIFSYDYTKSPQDLAYSRTMTVSPSLSWDITENDTIDLNFMLTRHPLLKANGFSLTEDLKLPDISKKAFLGADFQGSNVDSQLGMAQLTHRFGGDWVLTASGVAAKTNHVSNDAFYYGLIPASGDIPLTNNRQNNIVYDYAGDVTLTGDFKALGHTHSLAISASKRQSSYNFFSACCGTLGNINVYDPDPFGLTPVYTHLPTDPENHPSPDITFDDRRAQSSEGVSGLLLLHPLDRTTVLLGLRHTTFQLTDRSFYNPEVSYQDPVVFKDRATNKRLGVVYEVADGMNIYASYSDGTVFGLNRKASGGNLPPETGTQWEFGAKAALLNEKLTVSAAVFQLDRKNVAAPDPDMPPFSPFSIAISGQKHQGFELEAIGEPIPGWNLTASYSYLDVKINMCVKVDGACTDPFGWNGKQRVNSPHHMLKFYSTYQLLNGPLRGLSLGGGLLYTSARESDNQGTFKLPAYTRVDLRLGYDAFEHVSFSVNVINLTNASIYTSYWETPLASLDYQELRTVLFRMNFKY